MIQLIAAGLTDKEIGSQLCITQRTVSEHIVNIRSKLGAANRASAVYTYFFESLRQRKHVVAMEEETMSAKIDSAEILPAQGENALAIAQLRYAVDKISEGAEHLSPLKLERVLDDVNRELNDPLQRIYVARSSVDGKVVGYSSLERYAWNSPDSRDLRITVDPTMRGHGIGDALWRDVEAQCKRSSVTVLNVTVHDDQPEMLKFARNRGFAETYHRINFRLDLSGFDARRFASVAERTAALAIRLSDMQALGNTEEAQRRLYQLNSWCATLDLPGIKDEPDWNSWENFQQTVCQSWWYQPAGQIVAIDNQTGEWIGMCAVTANALKDGGSDVMHTGLDRRYRRNPVIGQALKLAAIEYCRKCGCQELADSCDSRDAANISLDYEMGFQRIPGWITLQKRVS